jgi:hypothetical protein
MRLLQHHSQQLGKDGARPQRVGVGEGRAPYPIRAQVIKPRRMALQSRHDLAKADGARELAIKQRHELALRRQTPHRASPPCTATRRSNTDHGTSFRTE